MSFPNLPENIGSTIDLNPEDVVLLILISIAFEELALAHIMNAEAEKLQAALGTLHANSDPLAKTLDDLLNTNRSVERMLRTVIKKEMLLQFKLEDVIDFLPTVTTTTTETPPPPGCDTCSIFYNRGALPTTVTGTINTAGQTDPLRIRFCAPCANPRFNEVRLDFNASGTSNDFRFTGVVTDIDSCSASTDTATLEGDGTITGNATVNGDYHFILQITSGTQAKFTFTNLTNSLTVVIDTSAAGKKIDIEDCTA